MPLFLEPDIRFRIALKIDKDKPIESRPVFFATSKSMRDAQAMSEEFDTMLKDSLNSKELYANTCEMLHKYVVGWQNMGGHEFPCCAADWAILTFSEAYELLNGIIANRELNVEEKKS